MPARIAGYAHGVDQLFQWQLLMRKCTDGGGTDLTQEISERLRPTWLHSQRQRADEEAHDILGFQSNPIGEWCSDQLVALPGQSLEQGAKACQECRKQRTAFGAREIAQLRGDCRSNAHRNGRASA